MKFIKENKLVIILGAVAIAIAFCCFNRSGCTSCSKQVKEPDTLIHFSFNLAQKEDLEAYFGLKYRKQGFNGVVLVGQSDSIFFNGCYGYSNYSSKDTFNLHSSFQLASVSKQFTAVSVLQLYQKGLIQLTDSLQKFFPGLPYKGITIHQLLCHRSGLPNYHYFLQHIPTTADTMLFTQDVVNEMINKFPEAYYRPNQRYHYSNTGYALLAAIVEKVSGMPFNEYVEKFIFKPLHMNNSFTYLDIYNKKIKATTTGYLYRWRQDEDNYLDGVLGDKGIYCSAADLFKWDQGLYSGKIIDTAILNLAFKPVGKPVHYKSNYGYGWRMFNWKNDSVKVLYHAGWWHGYKTLLMRIPSDTTTIIVLKNRSKGASISTKRLLKILYPPGEAIQDTLVIDDDNEG